MPQARLGDAAWLNEGPVARLLALLDRDGEEARVVGGAVRNALLGLPVAEIDVATTALVRNGTGATARPSSSRTTAASRRLAPPPPKRSGIAMPARPISVASVGWQPTAR